VGERQLICIARAVLRNSKVVIMDEATSNVDVRTDACIQKVIRDENFGIFSNASVLTIAHRLNTVIDYDYILVLDEGKVVEFGAPWELLEKSTTEESAWFARLVSELDLEVQTVLRKMSTQHRK
jgi:ABC-type multidrug transport system fused ATPase/permease subunit